MAVGKLAHPRKALPDVLRTKGDGGVEKAARVLGAFACSFVCTNLKPFLKAGELALVLEKCHAGLGDIY